MSRIRGFLSDLSIAFHSFSSLKKKVSTFIVTMTNQSLLNKTWSISLVLLEGSWYWLPVPQGAQFNLIPYPKYPHFLPSSMRFRWPELLRPTSRILFQSLCFAFYKRIWKVGQFLSWLRLGRKQSLTTRATEPTPPLGVFIGATELHRSESMSYLSTSLKQVWSSKPPIA